ncbi:MAG: hypothetical protein AB1451_10665 [Nitrospirota bacterium]
MRHTSLLILRISVGLLMVIWGIDKLANVQHALAVSDGFYLGLFSHPAVLVAFGALQTFLGLSVIVGYARKVLYSPLLVITGATMLGVWRSILDPWGWVLEGSNVLFFPSVIIFAASLVLWAFQDDDTRAIDHRRRRWT